MSRRLWVAAAAGTVVLAGFGFATRPAQDIPAYAGPPVTVSVPATSFGPTAPQTAAPVDAQPLVDLGQRFVTLYLAGRTGGGVQWVEDLRTVASDDLVTAVTFVDPEDIPEARLGEVIVEQGLPDGGAILNVGLRNGDRLKLTAAPIGGVVKIVSVERAPIRL